MRVLLFGVCVLALAACDAFPFGGSDEADFFPLEVGTMGVFARSQSSSFRGAGGGASAHRDTVTIEVTEVVCSVGICHAHAVARPTSGAPSREYVFKESEAGVLTPWTDDLFERHRSTSADTVRIDDLSVADCGRYGEFGSVTLVRDVGLYELSADCHSSSGGWTFSLHRIESQ